MSRVASAFQLSSLLARLKGDQLLQNLSWLGLAEVALRLVRIATTIIVARALTPVDFGVAATAIALFEVLRVFAKAGLMPAVVRASEHELARTAATVFRMALGAALVASALLVVIGTVTSVRTAQPQIVTMATVLALIFLLQPFGMVEEALLQRDGRMKLYGAIAAAQIMFESITAASLAYLGYGAWALIVSKLASLPLWLIAVRTASPWRLPRTDRAAVKEILKYCVPVIGSDLLAALRMNLDKMLVGAVLGIEALGVYYFAFNAGYGLSLTLTTALSTAAFTHLARARQRQENVLAVYDAAFGRAVVPVCLIIAAQALAAGIYVPMLFGAKWAFAAPYVGILCLAAATKPFFDCSAQLLRVAGLTVHEMAGAAVFSGCVLGALAIALLFGLTAGIAAHAAAACLGHVVFALWARRAVDRLGGPS